MQLPFAHSLLLQCMTINSSIPFNSFILWHTSYIHIDTHTYLTSIRNAFAKKSLTILQQSNDNFLCIAVYLSSPWGAEETACDVGDWGEACEMRRERESETEREAEVNEIKSE